MFRVTLCPSSGVQYSRVQHMMSSTGVGAWGRVELGCWLCALYGSCLRCTVTWTTNSFLTLHDMHMAVNGQLHSPARVKYSMVPSESEARRTRALWRRESLAITGKIGLTVLSFCQVTVSTDLFRCLGSNANAVNKQTNKRTDARNP
jgi:hypothetical protein